MNEVERIKRALKRNKFVEFAYLYGSQSRGEAGARSDWDIAVRFSKDPSDLPPWTAFYLEAEISREIGEEVHVVALNVIGSPVFLFQVINGIVLADRKTEKRILFEADVLRRYHDWGYYLKRHIVKSL